MKNLSDTIFKSIGNLSYIAKGSFWIWVGKGSSLLASLGIMIAFANLIPKETYGAYKYVLSFFAIASLFSLPGLNTIVSKSVAQGKESILLDAEKEKTKWGVFGSLFLLIISVWYIYKANYLLGISFLIGGIFLPIEQIVRMFSYVWQGRLQFKKQGMYESIGFIVPALLIIPVIFFTDNLIFIVITYFASYSSVRGIIYLMTRKTIIRNSGNTNEEAINFGRHLTFIQVISKIASQLDKIILWHFSGPLSVAVFSFAQMPVQQIKEFFPIQTLALPKLSVLGKEEAKLKIKRKFLLFFIIFIIITAVVILLAPIIYKIAFPKYIESMKYFKVLSLGIILMPFTLLGTHFISHTNTKALYIRTIAPIVKILLYVILVPIFKVFGIVYATLIGQCLDAGIVYYFFMKSTNE